MTISWNPEASRISFIYSLSSNANGPGLFGGGAGKSRNCLITCIDKLCHGFSEAFCQQTKLN
jgi:hypothetical protein